MKILWITNLLLPGACKVLGVQAPVVGGWMQASAMALVDQPDLQLAVATVYTGKDLKVFTHDRITYYLLPSQK
ncbi:MAG: glycosyl transferase family 1, partial [Bacteroidaceae bacterium]